MSGTADAGRLLVRIEATTDTLKRGLAQAEQAVSASGQNMQRAMQRADAAFQSAGAAASRANGAIAASSTAATRATEVAASTIDRMKGAASQAGSIMSQFSGAMAQGQTAVGALASSLPTLVAAMGIGGAAAAAATAVAFLASKFLETREAQVTLADAVRSSGETYNSLVQASERYRAGMSAERDQLVQLTQYYRSLNDEQVQYETRRLANEQQRLEAGRQSSQQAIEQERVLRRVQDAVDAYAESARQAAAGGGSLPPMAEFAPQVTAAWEAMARFRAEMSSAEGPSRDTAAAVISLSNGLSTAAGMGGRFTADLNAMVARLTAMVPAMQQGDDESRRIAAALALLAERATGSQVALTGVGAAASRTAAQLQALRDVANRNPTASVDQIRARVEAEIEALRRGGLEAQQRQAQQFREEDRVNQLREQAIRDRRTQLEALGATADEIERDIAQNSIAILQAAMGAANLEGQRDRLVSTAREAAREAGREGGRTAREAWIDAFDAPRLMAGTNILLLSEGDRRQAEEIRRLFAESRREAERAAEQTQRAAEREIERANQQLDRTSERFGGQISEALVDGIVDGGNRGQSALQTIATAFKRMMITALAEALNVTVFAPAVKAVLSGTGLVGAPRTPLPSVSGVPGTVGGNAGNTTTDAAGAVAAGRTLMSWPSFSNGTVTGGVGQVFAPGYGFETPFSTVNSALNAPAVSGISYGQLGAGALGIAGGAYGVYSGLQAGGAKGYTQAAGGAVGIAGGAAGLTVASGATAAGGALAGTAAGTAVAAVAAWAPYLAAAIFVASMLMSEKKPSNAAAGALIDLASGATQIMSSGKETAATGGARDQLVSLVQRATDQVSSLVGGIRPSGTIGFELGQRDPSKMFLNGNLVGSAGVGDTEGLAKLFNQALLQAFAAAPGLQDVEQRIFAASGQNLDFAVGLLTQTKSLVDTFGSDALNPDRNPATRAIYDAAIQTGSIENVVAALKGANELTQAYGDALNTADALKVVGAGGGNIQKIVSDLQWFFQVYQPLTDATVQVSALDQAIAASNKTYSDAITKATELGLATDKLAQKQVEAAEKIRQGLRDSYDAAMREATGGSAVTQAVGTASAIRANWNANALDYLAVGRDPNALYAAQMTAAFKELDITTLEKVVTELKGLDEVAVLFAQAALDAAKATAKVNAATAYDAQLREATGAGWVNQIIDLSNTIAANADAYRSAGKDPSVLYAAQVKQIIDGLDADALATAAQYLQGLDGVAADFLTSAIQAAQAAQETAAAADRLAAAAQIAADAADYDAKMRQALGLDLVNTIVAIRQEIDAMAARYAAAGRDPAALANAQINAALQGQDSSTLAKTAAGLQSLDAAAAAMATSALEQAIAAEVQAAQAEAAAAAAEAAAQAQQDAARAQQDAAREQERAASDAARAQEQAAQAAAQAVQELARAGQSIKDYVAKLRSGTSAGYSPTDRLAAAQAQYNADLALAQQNDAGALSRITSDADALIAAAQAMYASGTQFQAIRDQIITQLTALPAVTTAEQQMVDKLGSIDTKLSTSNTSLSSINTSSSSTASGTTTSNAKLEAARALLASIDANNDGVVTVEEIAANAKQRITEAQATLTAAAQQAATNTGATKTSVDASKTAIDASKNAIDLNTGKADEVKGEVTANNQMTAQIQQLNATLTAAATSTTGGFVALGTLLSNLTRYAAASAFNTMYSRPASVDPGISISSARGNLFGDGAMINAPTAVPLSIMGEGGRPEAVVPLEKDSRGRLGARIVGGSRGGVGGNDNRPVVEAIERGHELNAIGYQAMRDEMRAMRAEIASLRNAQQRRNAA